MRRSIRALALAALLPVAPAFAADLFVPSGGDLQAALDSAAPGDRVLVEAGVYSGSFSISVEPIEVVGLGGPAATILDGGGTQPVLHFESDATQATVFRGFTVRNGVATAGAGGIRTGQGRPLIEDCVVRQNSGKFGGGVSGNPVMRRCVIRDNTASLTHGGGLYGAPTLSECVVVGNTATSAHGGGIYLTGGSALVENSLVVSNRILFGDPARGAGIAVHSSAQAVIRNTVISRNTGSGNIFGSFGAGLWATPSTIVDKCTITGNVATSGNAQGAGIYGAGQVSSSIVRENYPDEVAGGPVLEWSNVLGGAVGAGNFDADPLWVDRYFTGDLHLTADSPCIDAGEPFTFDPDGSRSDVGAYPYADLYRTFDLVLEDWESPSWSALSATAGGENGVRALFDPNLSGGLYVVVASLSGTTPPTAFGGLVVPLVPDAYTQLMLIDPLGSGWAGASGLLDAEGRADALFALPAGVAPNLAGSFLSAAVVAFDPATAAPATVTEALRTAFGS